MKYLTAESCLKFNQIAALAKNVYFSKKKNAGHFRVLLRPFLPGALSLGHRLG